MTRSMTGFGKAEVMVNGKKIVVEVKSLNSKQLDISALKMPMIYKEKELEIRNKLSQSIVRGKVDFYVSVEKDASSSAPTINREVFKSYLEQISSITSELKMPMQSEPLVQTILRLPDIFNAQADEISDDEWNSLLNCVDMAIANLNTFRDQEGKITEQDLVNKVNSIGELLQQVSPFEGERIETIKNRITENLEKMGNDASVDKNRFEQELIYYMEKFDVNEEKVRLTNHCKYFIDTLNDDEPAGRKLGFIAQEMGREINTLGSKANHAEIQKIVVRMKDELEKIKEQLLNVL
ncbi:YicC/YloC family endoribonuclease [Perlabentimonas gracilis]|uniref:YicC/YloC family endoribonuclease n=1 Tax=Perlabentimonas gracilis TaxID=2715279 RepID=UPI001C63B3AE|nr:YicC/YloC family endoribonuclease [Perlabentimonas gracilis]